MKDLRMETLEVEARIEAIMAEETGDEYEPWDEYGIRELRDWAYREAGWDGDPWAEEDEAEDDDPDEVRRPVDWYAYNGVRRSDFF